MDRHSPSKPCRARSRKAIDRLSVSLLAVALGVAAACGNDPATSNGATSARRPSTPAVRPSGLVDDLVDVGHGRLHLRCVGAGTTTILLISGFNDGGDSWSGIERDLTDRSRVCSSARFGTGASDPPRRAQTFATAATDLRAALKELHEPGPYVVVGHSYGGAQAATFASQYRTEVGGLLLLDATPPGWITAGCAVPDDGSEWAASFREGCPDPTDPTSNPEWLDEVSAFAAVAAITSLSDLPVAVVTAAHHPFPGLAAAAATRLNEVWDEGQQHWLSLSSQAHLVSVDHTGHYIQHDRPDVTLSEIRGLLP